MKSKNIPISFVLMTASAFILILIFSLSQGDAKEAEIPKETAATAAHTPKLKRVADFSQPVEIKPAPGYPNLIFVVEQEGFIRVLSGGKKLSRPFLDARSRVGAGGEEGLLSVAFPPDYRKSKKFYIYYTNKSGDIEVAEYRRSSPTQADPRTYRSVIRIPHPENSNHNGGQMHFWGPHLYFGTGDGGSGGDPDENAQNLTSLLGKMIRINPNKSGNRSYSIPRQNPFVGRPGRDEVFSSGLRNPFRWSFQRVGRQVYMIIADVGQDRFEEINRVPLSKAKGANFGWDRFEGFSEYESKRTSAVTWPIIALPRSEGYCSVIGGIVVRDPSLTIRGRYIFADFCRSGIEYFWPNQRRVSAKKVLPLDIGQISSFTNDSRGKVWLTTLSGTVYRLV